MWLQKLDIYSHFKRDNFDEVSFRPPLNVSDLSEVWMKQIVKSQNRKIGSYGIGCFEIVRIIYIIFRQNQGIQIFVLFFNSLKCTVCIVFFKQYNIL